MPGNQLTTHSPNTLYSYTCPNISSAHARACWASSRLRTSSCAALLRMSRMASSFRTVTSPCVPKTRFVASGIVRLMKFRRAVSWLLLRIIIKLPSVRSFSPRMNLFRKSFLQSASVYCWRNGIKIRWLKTTSTARGCTAVPQEGTAVPWEPLTPLTGRADGGEQGRSSDVCACRSICYATFTGD